MSFGLAQMIVVYHYHGDHTNTLENISAVREYVFDHPEEDLRQMCLKLRNCLYVGGGDSLQALITYNSGSPHPEGDWYWVKYFGNIANYSAALERAKELLAE